MDVPSLWNLFFQWSRRPHLSFVYERKSRFSPGWAQVAQSEDIYLVGFSVVMKLYARFTGREMKWGWNDKINCDKFFLKKKIGLKYGDRSTVVPDVKLFEWFIFLFAGVPAKRKHKRKNFDSLCTPSFRCIYACIHYIYIYKIVYSIYIYMKPVPIPLSCTLWISNRQFHCGLIFYS